MLLLALFAAEGARDFFAFDLLISQYKCLGHTA